MCDFFYKNVLAMYVWRYGWLLTRIFFRRDFEAQSEALRLVIDCY